jgi:hypothetical protein
MRIQSAPLKAMVESTARALDAANAFPPPPAALGGARLTDLMRTGKIKVTVDPKYPQAIGIASILKMALTFANSAWDILKNPFGDCPFFTSDFPAAIEDSTDPRVLNRIVPLTPNLAVRIRPVRLLHKIRGRVVHEAFDAPANLQESLALLGEIAAELLRYAFKLPLQPGPRIIARLSDNEVNKK